MARLDVQVVLGEALVLPMVALSLPKAKNPGAVKLAIEAHQVPELARLMSFASPNDEVAVLAADVARDLLDELEHLDRKAPRLQAPGAVHHVFWSVNGTVLQVSDDAGWSIWLQRDHGDRDPLWYGRETRMDSMGVAWSRQMGRHVTDDFGTLVKVQGGAA